MDAYEIGDEEIRIIHGRLRQIRDSEDERLWLGNISEEDTVLLSALRLVELSRPRYEEYDLTYLVLTRFGKIVLRALDRDAGDAVESDLQSDLDAED